VSKIILVVYSFFFSIRAVLGPQRERIIVNIISCVNLPNSGEVHVRILGTLAVPCTSRLVILFFRSILITCCINACNVRLCWCMNCVV